VRPFPPEFNQRGRPDFPLKGLVRCATCGKTLTASWSKGRNGRYPYYHCWRQCRAVNVTKAKLEGLFVDELEQLQPTPGYMRLVKELVLRAWERRKAEVAVGIAAPSSACRSSFASKRTSWAHAAISEVITWSFAALSMREYSEPPL
jgi:hypothetical protein